MSDNWKHRSDSMKCKSCMWFVPKAKKGEDGIYDLGRCRRRSPTLNGWPAVYVNDWCGDHKIDENRVPGPTYDGQHNPEWGPKAPPKIANDMPRG